jgi:hypothetical protein
MIEAIYAAVRYLDLNILKCSLLDLMRRMRSKLGNDS